LVVGRWPGSVERGFFCWWVVWDQFRVVAHRTVVRLFDVPKGRDLGFIAASRVVSARGLEIWLSALRTDGRGTPIAPLTRGMAATQESRPLDRRGRRSLRRGLGRFARHGLSA